MYLRPKVLPRLIAALAASAVAIATPVVSSAAPKQGGSLAQLGGAGGCVYDPAGGSASGLHVDLPGRCAAGSALDGAYDAVTSPDGKHLYVASFNGDSISVFARNKANGQLRQLDGADGCVVEDPYDSPCASAIALDNPGSLLVSPDGRNVYATSYYSHAISGVARVAATGRLTQLSGTGACTSAADIEYACAEGTALGGASSAAISPDGRHVYVAAALSNAVAIFARNRTNGALTQLAGAAGCLRDSSEGAWEGDVCTPALGIDLPTSVAVSADGKNVYVAAFGSASVAILRRDTASGKLTALTGPAACHSQERLAGMCTAARSLEGAFAVTVSRDGKSVYVATGFDRKAETDVGAFGGSGVTVFARRAADGALTQLAGKAGCVTHAVTGQGCARGRVLEGAQAVSVSPDGRNVYVAAAASNAVSIFARDAKNGALRQLTGKAGCVSESGNRGSCQNGAGLWGVSALAVSPDGKNAYAAGYFSSAVAVFARTAPARRSGR